MATTTTTTVASPVDFETYGDYAPPAAAYRREGNLTSLIYPIDGRISDDGSTQFAAESGRYHLYFSLYCPWAQRPLIALKLRGLDNVVSWSAVDPVRDGRGWAFREGDGPRSRSGQRLHAAPRRVPRNRSHLRRSRLRARALGPRDRQAGEQPLRDDDRRSRDVFHRVGGSVGRAVPRTPSRRDRRGERRDRARPRGWHLRRHGREHASRLRRGERPRVRRARSIRGPVGRLAGSSLPTTSPTPTFSSTSTSSASTSSPARSGGSTFGDSSTTRTSGATRATCISGRHSRETTNLDHIKIGTFRTGAGIRTSRIVPAGPIADWDAPHDRDQLG